MRIYDISLPVSKRLLTWPGDRRPRIQQTESVARGGVATSHIALGSHTGTHVDAPKHFLLHGKSLDRIALEKLVGQCRVLSIPRTVKEIQPQHLQRFRIRRGERILLKTANTAQRLLFRKSFPGSYVALSPEAAVFLAKRGIALVGADFLGIEARGAKGHPVHRTLLKHRVVIVEGLNLRGIRAGTYGLAVLPLAVVGTDGAPARAILTR